jgi:hypothetical protein
MLLIPAGAASVVTAHEDQRLEIRGYAEPRSRSPGSNASSRPCRDTPAGSNAQVGTSTRGHANGGGVREENGPDAAGSGRATAWVHQNWKTVSPGDDPFIFPETSSTVRPAPLKRRKPRSRGYRSYRDLRELWGYLLLFCGHCQARIRTVINVWPIRDHLPENRALGHVIPGS